MVSQGQYTETDTDLIQGAGLHLKVTSGLSNILLMIHFLKKGIKVRNIQWVREKWRLNSMEGPERQRVKL